MYTSIECVAASYGSSEQRLKTIPQMQLDKHDASVHGHPDYQLLQSSGVNQRTCHFTASYNGKKKTATLGMLPEINVYLPIHWTTVARATA